MKKSDKQADPFLTVFNAITDPALLIDSAGLVLQVNSAFEKELGFKSKDIIGKDSFKVKLFSTEL